MATITKFPLIYQFVSQYVICILGSSLVSRCHQIPITLLEYAKNLCKAKSQPTLGFMSKMAEILTRSSVAALHP